MRLAMGLEYDGSTFHGWQRQSAKTTGDTAQGLLETALAKIADHPVSTVVAGRTDVGVHACEQVVHFDTLSVRKPDAWVRGTNSLLPRAMRVLWARVVSDDFHARFSAIARRYCYALLDGAQPAALWRDRCHQTERLSVELMRRGASYFPGKRDMSSFRSSRCQARNPCRRIYFLRIHRRADWVLVDIQANAFLHHMVRNIVGSLLVVGLAVEPPEWIASLLACKDRTRAAATAPPNGLYLTRVRYDVRWGLPIAKRFCPIAVSTDLNKERRARRRGYAPVLAG